MNVFDNLAFGLRRRGFERSEIRRRVDDAAAMLGLNELVKRKPHALSGGQRQRVALGRAIVRDPTVFLFDEPLSNLDASLRASMRGEIVRLHQRLRATMIYVTHDQAEAMTMSDRLCIMDHGEVVQVGRPLEVYRSPRSTFVARFLGASPMNLLPATLEIESGRPVARLAGVALPLPGWRPDQLSARIGQAVTLGLRPEHVRETSDGAADTTRVRVRVRAVEPLGAETLLVTELNDLVVTARVDGAHPVQVNESIDLFVRVGESHLFDPDTSLAIPRLG
jgi:multiple sugar transport system ATP-binding protein